MNRREQLMSLFPYGHTNYSLKNKEHIKEVISKAAYSDVKRQFHGIGNNTERVKKRDLLFDELTKEFYNYFESKPINCQSKYDEWHKKICNEIIIDSLKDNIDNDMTYGKAQKLLNMSMKHFYCFSEAEKKETYFSFCHIPIDGNVIEWYKKNIDKQYSVEWTKMNYNEYEVFQEKVRLFLISDKNVFYKDENGPFSSLESDFLIWIMRDLLVYTDLWLKAYDKMKDYDNWNVFNTHIFAKQIEEINLKSQKIISKLNIK